MSTQPQPLFDMSKATPIQGAPVPSSAGQPLFDMSKAAPVAGVEQPSLGSKIVEGAKQSQIVQAVTPPTSATEAVISTVGGPGALPVYRSAKGIVDSVENLVKHPTGMYESAAQDFKRAIDDFHKKDWRNLASDVVSSGADLAATTGVMPAGASQARELSEGARPGGNLATPLTRDVLDAATIAATGRMGAAGEAETVGTRLRFNPFRARLLAAKQAVAPAAEIAGETIPTRPTFTGAGQEAATQAVKTIAGETSGAAGGLPVSHATSLRDVFDEPIAARESVAKTFYKALDDASDNQWTANENALKNVRRDIQMKGGINEEVDAALNAKKIQLEWQQEQILDKVPPGTAEQARSNWYAKSRLEDIQDIFNKKANVSGVHPDMVKPGVKGLPAEKYNFKGIAKDLNAMDPKDLTTALGKDQAQNLVAAVNLAAKQGWASGKALAAIKTALQVMGLGHAGAMAGLLP